MPQGHGAITLPTQRAQLGAFLRSRRERLSPGAIGLPNLGRRRTAGLRREEVAQLAGISAAWYTQLEQGRDVHPSPEVLDALAAVLRLEESERAYLFQLAHGPRLGADRRTPPSTAAVSEHGGVPPTVRRLLDALGPTPALVIDRRWNLVGANAAFAAVLPDLGPAEPDSTAPRPPGVLPRNVVEYALTSPALRAGLRDWAQVARLATDGLRASLAGVAPDDPTGADAAALVTRLSAASPEFRAWWPEQGLWAADRPVTHVYEHPRVGPIAVDGTMLDVRSAPGLTLVTYVPRDPESADRLRRLHSQN